jgi:hypothetical protein
MNLELCPRLKKLISTAWALAGLAIVRLLSWFPALKCLALFDSSVIRHVDFAHSLQTHCPLSSSSRISRTGRERYIHLVSSTYSLLPVPAFEVGLPLSYRSSDVLQLFHWRGKRCSRIQTHLRASFSKDVI